MNAKKSILPHIIAVAAFFLFTLIYFLPQFKGMEIYQGDIVNFKGMSKEIVDFREATGEEALWTGSMFCGMPAYQISVKFTANLMMYVDKFMSLYIPRPAGLVFLYLIGFYFLGLMLKWDWRLAMLGAFGFALSSYFFIILEAGHNSKANAIAYMAPLLGAILMTLRGRWMLGAGLTALFMALELKANHFQITYYTFMLVFVIGIVYLVDAVKKGALKSYLRNIGVLAVAIILAIGTNAGRIWTTYEYTPYTTRGESELVDAQPEDNKTSGLNKDYATAWSYGVAETFTLLIPDFMGGGSRSALEQNSNLGTMLGPGPQAKQFLAGAPTYWGQQPFTSGPVYAGAILCFLFILGLFILPKGARVWLGVGTLFSIALAWGKNFMPLTDFFLEYIPFYNKFRAVSMILVVAELCIPLGAMMTLHHLFKTKPSFNEISKKFFYALGLTGGFAFIMGLIGPSFFDFEGISDVQFSQAQWYDALIADRIAMMRSDAFRSFFLILAAGALMWLFLKQRLKGSLLILGLGVLVLVDMVPINKRYLNDENFVPKQKVEEPFVATAADKQIMQDDGYYRVYNTTEALDKGARTSYFHKSLGGYHGAKMRRYQELLDRHVTTQYPNREVINMLNAKYFIVQGPAARRNPDALGAAWKVEKIRWAEGPDDILKEMENFRSFRTVVIDVEDAERIGSYDPEANVNIEVESYQPNHITYNYSSDKPALIVFSEIYYPLGWDVYVDGVKSDYWCANYVLRSMTLPAGEHLVEFKFEPQSYVMGSRISLICSILLLAGVVLMIYLDYKSKRGFNEE